MGYCCTVQAAQCRQPGFTVGQDMKRVLSQISTHPDMSLDFAIRVKLQQPPKLCGALPVWGGSLHCAMDLLPRIAELPRWYNIEKVQGILYQTFEVMQSVKCCIMTTNCTTYTLAFWYTFDQSYSTGARHATSGLRVLILCPSPQHVWVFFGFFVCVRVFFV